MAKRLLHPHSIPSESATQRVCTHRSHVVLHHKGHCDFCASRPFRIRLFKAVADEFSLAKLFCIGRHGADADGGGGGDGG